MQISDKLGYFGRYERQAPRRQTNATRPRIEAIKHRKQSTDARRRPGVIVYHPAPAAAAAVVDHGYAWTTDDDDVFVVKSPSDSNWLFRTSEWVERVNAAAGPTKHFDGNPDDRRKDDDGTVPHRGQRRDVGADGRRFQKNNRTGNDRNGSSTNLLKSKSPSIPDFLDEPPPPLASATDVSSGDAQTRQHHKKFHSFGKEILRSLSKEDRGNHDHYSSADKSVKPEVSVGGDGEEGRLRKNKFRSEPNLYCPEDNSLRIVRRTPRLDEVVAAETTGCILETPDRLVETTGCKRAETSESRFDARASTPRVVVLQRGLHGFGFSLCRIKNRKYTPN